ncbi:radical SAM/SPASM domain-containing protein [Actinospica robiniae]|uniref:radical SAM/SPASM domain-containing protein n=1 Tax=Actinospica robiniae TaxID=304901 RepID=UPI000402E9FB|nr:radical SAM protein [Actinospica robiniae]
MPGLLTLIVKATRECNLRCSYCNDWRSTANAISLETADLMVRRAMAAKDVTAVHFNWHGGEPTLVPLDFYRHVFAEQARHRPAGRKFTNTLQTNGTRLTDEWLDFLVAQHVGLGISIDGPPEIHDRMRPTRGGGSSSRLIEKTLVKVRDRGIPHGVSIVASHELVGKGPEYIWSFLQSAGISNVTLVPVRPPNPVAGDEAAPTISPEFLGGADWSAYLCGLFDLWWSSDSTVKINNFDAVLRKLLGRAPRSCLISGNCLGSVYGIEADGTIMHCELFQGEPDRAFGNLASTTFDEVAADLRMAALRQADAERLGRYRECPTFGICAGGCPHEWYIHEGYGKADQLGSCCGWRPLVEHIAKRLAASKVPAEALAWTS